MLILVLRLGDVVETGYGALRTLHFTDPMLRFSCTLGRIASVLYQVCDNLMSLERLGYLKLNKDKWTSLMGRCWLYSITMNLARDFYEIWRIFKNDCSYFSKKSHQTSLASHLANLVHLVGLRLFQENKDVAIDVVKNICDVFLPLNMLQKVHLRPNIIGLLGIISSIIGIYTILNPIYKLTPA